MGAQKALIMASKDRKHWVGARNEGFYRGDDSIFAILIS
jgi:hypothetical protein